jgi:hypothetical protein
MDRDVFREQASRGSEFHIAGTSSPIRPFNQLIDPRDQLRNLLRKGGITENVPVLMQLTLNLTNLCHLPTQEFIPAGENTVAGRLTRASTMMNRNRAQPLMYVGANGLHVVGPNAHKAGTVGSTIAVQHADGSESQERIASITLIDPVQYAKFCDLLGSDEFMEFLEEIMASLKLAPHTKSEEGKGAKKAATPKQREPVLEVERESSLRKPKKSADTRDVRGSQESEDMRQNRLGREEERRRLVHEKAMEAKAKRVEGKVEKQIFIDEQNRYRRTEDK